MRIFNLIWEAFYQFFRMPKIKGKYKYVNLVMFLFSMAFSHGMSALIIRWSFGSMIWPGEPWTWNQVFKLFPAIILFEVSYRDWTEQIQDRISYFFRYHFRVNFLAPEDPVETFLDQHIYTHNGEHKAP